MRASCKLARVAAIVVAASCFVSCIGDYDESEEPHESQTSSGLSTSSFTAVLYQNGAYDKPLVFFEGYDPKDDYKPAHYWAPYYSDADNANRPALLDPHGTPGLTYATGGFPVKAANEGWDVWVVSVNWPASMEAFWALGTRYITEGLHDSIRNYGGVTRKIVITGFSAGGLLARRALTYMGSSRRVAEVRAYISLDVPHEGAYVPYSLQMYMFDHKICGFTALGTDAVFCHTRFVNHGLRTSAADSLLKNRLYKTCGTDTQYSYPSFWSDCGDTGGCTLPNDGEFSHCGGTGNNIHGTFAKNLRAPSWFSTNYGGWFTDIPRYAISNSSMQSNYLPPNDLYTARFEIMQANVDDFGDHHLYTETAEQPKIRGSMDPFLDRLHNVSTDPVFFGWGDALLIKKAGFNFVSFDSAFGRNSSLTWTGKLLGLNKSPATAYHWEITSDTLTYLDKILTAAYSGTTAPGDYGPASLCGNGACAGKDNGETATTCPADCKPWCGDRICSAGEYTTTCPTDCGSRCGDGVCNGGETSANCNDCLPCCGTCFEAGTSVAMADGRDKPIEEVVAGDVVFSYDTATKQVVPGKVKSTMVHPNTEGTILINGTLRTTPNHEFFANGVWKHAEDLAIGDTLVMIDGAKILSGLPGAQSFSVSSLLSEPLRLTTYNFDVEGYDNYFAGGVLVHNKEACRDCGGGDTNPL